MFRIPLGVEGDAHVRVTEVASTSWQRGHSYETLVVTMKSGEAFLVRDYQGSAYAVERALLQAIEGSNG